MPAILSPTTFLELFHLIENLIICTGQPDDEFINLLKLRKGKIVSPKGTISAYIDNNSFVSYDKFFLTTVRTAQCEVLVKTGTCKSCKLYRPTLKKLCNRLNHCAPINSSSHTNKR